MATDTKARYSDAELDEFKKLIEVKINKAQEDLELLKSAYMNDGNNGTDDTSPTFKAFEEGSETMSKEANTQLAIRQEKFIRDLKNSMIRIENKTYGVCRVTGKLINKKRLLLVPQALQLFYLVYELHGGYSVNVLLQPSGVVDQIH